MPHLGRAETTRESCGSCCGSCDQRVYGLLNPWHTWDSNPTGSQPPRCRCRWLPSRPGRDQMGAPRNRGYQPSPDPARQNTALTFGSRSPQRSGQIHLRGSPARARVQRRAHLRSRGVPAITGPQPSLISGIIPRCRTAARPVRRSPPITAPHLRPRHGPNPRRHPPPRGLVGRRSRPDAVHRTYIRLCHYPCDKNEVCQTDRLSMRRAPSSLCNNSSATSSGIAARRVLGIPIDLSDHAVLFGALRVHPHRARVLTGVVGLGRRHRHPGS